jgi:NADH-ubiquinone oxidoreductase chain 2
MKVTVFLFLILIKTPQLIYIPSLIFGTILATSSSSWLIAWIGLEINLIRFTPLLINKLKPSSIEIIIKYFLVQAIASIMIILIGLLLINASSLDIYSYAGILITISLALKSGVAPFHFWFPQVIEYAEWFQVCLILTWQKIAPLVLLCFFLNPIVYLIIISSAIIGILGGLNQTSLKKILTYSSIIHSSWLISILFIRDSLWWFYFLAYTIITISIIIPVSVFQITNITSINQLKINIKTKILISLNLLSLSGLPPFLGFTIKLYSVNTIITNSFDWVILITLIISSLVAFYFYCRIIYSALLSFEGQTKIFYFPPEIKSLGTKIILISFLGNVFIPILVLIS